jgi:hypothetical protein
MGFFETNTSGNGVGADGKAAAQLRRAGISFLPLLWERVGERVLSAFPRVTPIRMRI